MWNGFSSAFLALVCLICGLSLWSVARSAIQRRALLAEWKQLRDSLNAWQRSCSQETFDARVSEIEATLAALANRVKMQRVRTAVDHATTTTLPKTPSTLPDPYTDPDGWRAAVNAKLARAKFGLTS